MPKISQLPEAVNITATDQLPIVQNGQTMNIDINSLLAGIGGTDTIWRSGLITNKTFATNDYIKFPDGPNGEPGLIIQWFSTVFTSPAEDGNGLSSINIDFPIAFPNGVFAVVITPKWVDVTCEDLEHSFSVANETATGFTLKMKRLSGAGAGTEQNSVVVAAIGN